MSPKDNNKQVSAAVRILHQKRDASARATHLIAENWIVQSSTIERKIMSTKTSFKRIALVAAAALALGGVSVVTATSASAIVPSTRNATMYDTTNGYQVVGGEATVEIGFDSSTAATVVSSGVGTIQSATPAATGLETLTAVTSTGFRYTSRATTTAATGVYGGLDSVSVVLVSAVAGVQTLTITPLATNGTPGTAVTKTITWTAAGTTAAASWSAYLRDTTTVLTVADQLVDSTVAVSKDKGTAGTPAQVALIAAKLKDSNGNAVSGATVSVTVSGPGLIIAEADADGLNDGLNTTTGINQRVASVTTIAGGYVVVHLSGDGTAGVSTVTLTSGTVSVSRSVTFTGAIASYTLTGLTGTYGVGAYGADDSLTGSLGIKVQGKDSAGGTAVIGTYYATSSNKAVATVSASGHDISDATGGKTAGTGFIAVTGVSAGKSTITIRNTDPAGTTAPTVTATIEVEVTSSTANSVTMSLDKASYAPGEPGVLSITLTNAAGRPVADGTYTIFAAATPLAVNLFMQDNNVGANGAFASGVSVTTYNGVAAFDIFAPSVSGDLTFTGTTLAASTATSQLTTAARALALTATATVSGGAADANAALALDAANAATDAANNAYDEAQNATQAASDALAAVTALAAQVKTLIASVKKLTAAVAKLKK
jgi:protocatechuate 3,4-dioxygenase beta subunit